MAFSLDLIVSFVKIDEPDLISIHRSIRPIVPSDENCLGHLCDAFICAARENNVCRVYIALYDTRQKSNLVFVADPVAVSECNGLIRQAELFLSDLGFSMEPVNVNFSPATREVILRDIKVMRPPKHVAQKRKFEVRPPAQAAEETPPQQVAAAEEQACRSDSAGAGREALLIARLAGATSALESMAAEKEELARKTSREFKKLRAERDRLSKELDAAEAARLDAESAPTADNGIAAALEAERDTLRNELSAHMEESEKLRCEFTETRAELERQNRLLRREIELIGSERDTDALTLSDELEAAREALAASAEMNSKAIAAVEAERDTLRAGLAAAGEETDALRSALMEARAELGKVNDRLGLEIGRLRDEREVAMVSLSNEVETLRATLAIADEKLGAERAKNESALREMEALERNAADEMRSFKNEIDSLAAEKRRLETMAAELKLKAKGEIERLQAVNQSQRCAALKKVNALKEEMRHLAEARVAMTSPFGAALAQGSAQDASLAAGSEKAPSQAGDIMKSADPHSDPFALLDFGDYMNFEPDSSLAGIPYDVPGDVVEVHRSFNKIQAAPAGHVIQSCEGFVCLVRDGGQEMVYVAWLMNTTGAVLVCRPEPIPASCDAVRRAVREGIDYFERVGFFMDRLDLETDPEARQRQFDTLPIFRRIALVCAA